LQIKFNLHIFGQLVGIDKEEKENTKNKKKQKENEYKLNDSFRSNIDRATQMCQAARRGDLVELQSLVIHHGTSVDTADYDHRTAMHLACSEGYMDMVRFLVDNNANINVQDRWGNTPCDEAVYGKHFELVTFLESKG